jgi:hypothetical protein
LQARPDRRAPHRDDVPPIERAAAPRGGEQADLDRLGKRRLACRALASAWTFRASTGTITSRLPSAGRLTVGAPP